MHDVEPPEKTAAEYEALIASLVEEKSALVEEKSALAEKNESLKALYDKTLFALEKAWRGIFGQKRERLTHAGQLSILDLLEQLDVFPEAPATGKPDDDKPSNERESQTNAQEKKRKKKKKGHGRRKLDKSKLPVIDVVVEPAEKALPGGDALIKIGEEVSEHLEHRPASTVRVRVTRPKYRQPETGKITIGEVPERAAPRSLAGPGLLAHVLVSKYGDHLPLHRQAQIFKRQGCSLSRSTLSDWVRNASCWLEYISDAMWHDAKCNSPYTLVDATGVLVRAPRVCKRTHFYTAVVPGRHVLFRHLDKNDGRSVADTFKDFTGYFHADASSVYHELFRKEDVTEVGCWAHARRKFFDILSQDEERALIGIGLIAKLYDAQRQATRSGGTVDKCARAQASRPMLARLFRWARIELRKSKDVMPAGVATALGYVLRHRKPLTRFLEDGRLRLDNNPAELALRHEVIGRKNWIFCGSGNGARWNTVVVSLIASCKIHGIEPWRYLRDVLTLLPAWKTTDVLDLAPVNFAATMERPNVKALIASARPFDDHALMNATVESPP